MQTNNLDKNIKEKLQNRTFMPSNSAWERLSAQLDEQPKQKKRGWFFYIGAAASILLLISVSFFYLNKTHSDEPIDIIVNNPIDTVKINTKINNLINEVPVEKAIVKVDKTKQKSSEKKKNIIKNRKSYSNQKRIIVAQNNITKKEKETIAKVDVKKHTIDNKKLEVKTKTIKNKPLKQDPNSSIKINSEDLLYAVTHSAQDVKAYYAKHNLTRDNILKTIKSELKKSNLKVNPETILAEVERNIDDENYQNNFIKSIKRRVSDIATAIASRNN